jgi:NarL family two-component system response regulator LiaR
VSLADSCGYEKGRLSPPFSVALISISILSSRPLSLRQVLGFLLASGMSELGAIVRFWGLDNSDGVGGAKDGVGRLRHREFASLSICLRRPFAAAILLHNTCMKRHVLIFGLVGGLLIAVLQYTEYRFVVIEHSVELYGALVAILFAAFGIWLGLRITRSRETVRETVVVREVIVPVVAPSPIAVPFAPNTGRQQTLGITARELEVLTLVGRGLSNREIATQLFVSENTVKTHCARAFDKLGAARRTQAVQRGKELGLLP